MTLGAWDMGHGKRALLRAACIRRLSWVRGLAVVLLSISGTACRAGVDEQGKPAPKRGQFQGFAPPEEHAVSATLITEHASVQPGGRTRIGVFFEMAEGWHIYAENPGDAGLPTTVEWWIPLNGEAPGSLRPPPGIDFEPLQWPQPQEFHDPGNIKTFGYTGSLVLASVARIESWQKPETTIPIRAKVKWLACKEICVPGSAELELPLPVSTEAPALSPQAKLFGRAQE